MSVTGIIAEYNPFHNGHLHQINSIKHSDNEQIIVVMSGNWVQRGSCAIIDKYTRTRMALEAGIDMVIELPVHISTGSARDFSYGSVSLLNSLGCIDNLCFGLETNDLSLIDRISDYLVNESDELSSAIKTGLKSGLSYPSARYKALQALNSFTDEDLDLLTSPNNILGLEYAIAVKKLNSSIKLSPILRHGSAYNDSSIDSEGLSSATAIRNAMLQNDSSSVLANVPDYIYNLITMSNFRTIADFNDAIRYKLLTENDFTQYLDVTRELSDKINNTKLNFTDIEEYTHVLKSKNMTFSHISRCLIHILLNITKETPKDAEYIRVLGFRKDSESLFGKISQSASLPIITKPSYAIKQLDDNVYSHFQNDVTASQLYDSHNEFSTPLVII